MNLQYDTEQIILRDTAESFLRQHYGYDTYRRVVASDEGWSAELWREFAQLGWLGLPFAMEDGGIGGGAVEAAILMEAFGRFLVIEPYLPTVLLAGGLIAALGSTAERKALLTPLSEGRNPARLCVRGSGYFDHCKVRFPRIFAQRRQVFRHRRTHGRHFAGFGARWDRFRRLSHRGVYCP